MNFPASNGMQQMRYALKKSAKPTMKISEVQHKYLNHFYYYPGRLEWEPISITFASVKIGKDGELADNVLIQALKASGYVYPATDGSSAISDLNTIAKRDAVANLTNSRNMSTVHLVQINEKGEPIETWYLFNPFFTDMKYDSLEYGSEEILNIDCTIKYDFATLEDQSGKQLVTNRT